MLTSPPVYLAFSFSGIMQATQAVFLALDLVQTRGTLHAMSMHPFQDTNGQDVTQRQRG